MSGHSTKVNPMKQWIDVPVRMSDGINLSTDIRLPDPTGSFPTLLLRTPYGNTDPSAILRYVETGYAVVMQDCRGRFDSEGRFNPFAETGDGRDTIAWIRSQPWCNGRIGMIGGSYLASTQLAAASTNPDGLEVIVPRVMGRDAFKDMLYYNGVLNLPIAVGWGLAMAGRAGQSNATTDWIRVYRHLPLQTMDEAAGYNLPYFKNWLAHPRYDGFWEALSVEAHYAHFNIPMLHIGGWYDIYNDGTLRNFQGIRAQGGPRARPFQKLVMGPWAHALNTRILGPVDFGPNAITDLDGLEARWLSRFLKDDSPDVDTEPPVRLFIMGTNVWRDEPEWPLARAVEQAWHLDSAGNANSLNGNGILTTGHPHGADTDCYTYNPEHPVPCLGGCFFGPSAGPQDHAAIEHRHDVLVYTGPVLQEPLETTGYITAVLYIASDAPDTDFVARLCDVHPDGRSLVLCDGIVRTRFREGLDHEVMMQPGRVYELTIGMTATANTFLPGHRVRLEITSSCFPRFARNLNTGDPIPTAIRMQCARQTIHHSTSYPSRLILPIIRNP